MAPTVTPLCCGSITMDAAALLAGRTGVEVEAPSIVYLIEGEETLLVDTSFGDRERMAERHPGFGCHRPPERDPIAVLDRAGYAPADVDGVVLSHLDWDHCYNLDPFVEGGADVYVSRTELEYAVAPYPLHASRYESKALGREPPWLTVDLAPVEGETTVAPGVTLVPTPGHTVGHQSVAVETADGVTVAAADAIPTFANVRADEARPFVAGAAVDELDWWRSARAVRERADRLLPGHEWGILAADPVTDAGTVGDLDWD